MFSTKWNDTYKVLIYCNHYYGVFCYHIPTLFYQLLENNSSWICHIFSSLSINSQFAQIPVHSMIGKIEMSPSPEQTYRFTLQSNEGIISGRADGPAASSPCVGSGASSSWDSLHETKPLPVQGPLSLIPPPCGNCILGAKTLLWLLFLLLLWVKKCLFTPTQRAHIFQSISMEV